DGLNAPAPWVPYTVRLCAERGRRDPRQHRYARDEPLPRPGRAVPRPGGAQRIHCARRRRADVLSRKKGAGCGQLDQTDPLTRTFERTIANLTAVNPYTGVTDALIVRMADQIGMKALHMFTAGDPTRNPSFVYFADPNYFITDFPANTCETCVNPAFAWNHGDIQPEIANTWLSFVGPGVLNEGQDQQTWSDHADVRPTILTLLGLRDMYVHDGRALTEAIEASARPAPLRVQTRTLSELTRLFKQINAPFGRFARDSLTVSTAALVSDTPSDTTYATLQQLIAGWVARRDSLADAIKTMLTNATFGDGTIDEGDAKTLVQQARALLKEVNACATNVAQCAPAGSEPVTRERGSSGSRGGGTRQACESGSGRHTSRVRGDGRGEPNRACSLAGHTQPGRFGPIIAAIGARDWDH